MRVFDHPDPLQRVFMHLHPSIFERFKCKALISYPKVSLGNSY